MKILVKRGSQTQTVTTDSNGTFRTTKYFDYDADVYFIYSNEKYIVRDYTDPLGTGIQHYMGNATNGGGMMLISTSLLSLYRGLNFWFYGSHQVSKSVHNFAINIYYKHYEGRANYTYGTNTSHINIYNNHLDWQAIYTICHELGHALMHKRKGNKSYKNTDPQIRESWACFTGWYVSREYYRSLGLILTNHVVTEGFPKYPGRCSYCDTNRAHQHDRHVYQMLTFGDQQKWKTTTTGEPQYSPLFIDLLDDYNQREIEWLRGGDHRYLPNDRIKNVPVNIIESIAMNSTGTATIRYEMLKHVPQYIDAGDASELLRYYLDNWVK